ncbi:MAG: glycine cleavage system protein H [Planctomycetaceae bacterium]
MSEDLVFMMGKFEARIPCDRKYSDSHLWLQPVADAYRVGFTAYSVRLLQDVYFLEWSIDPNTGVTEKMEIGEIESSKALSTLYAPSAGQLTHFNEKLLDDPTPINTDGYDAGWLYELQTDGTFLAAEKYRDVLEAGWEDTQRLLKGQVN